MIAGFLTFAAITFWAAAVIWAVDELLHRRRTRRLDRHIDEAIAVTETPAEDRPDWGLR